MTNFSQSNVSRIDVQHFLNRVFKNLVCLLYLVFSCDSYWVQKTEALKAEPQDGRIWVPKLQVKENYQPGTVALSC